MNKPVCILQSALFTRSGYGDWSMAIAKSLLRYDKFDLKIVPTRWGGCPTKHSIDDLEDEQEKLLFNQILRGPLPKQPEVYIQISIPNEFNGVGKVNIGMTAGIETTVPKPEWIEGLNKMDVNFVLSNFVKDVFLKTSYKKTFNQTGQSEDLKSTKPMEVLFWGANTEVYKKVDEKINSVDVVLDAIKEDFCFLFVGQWTHNAGLYNDRKDIGNLIKTFLTTFRDEKKKPALVLKTSGVSFSKIDKYEILDKIDRIKKEVGGDNLPQIYLLHGDLTDAEMNYLYNHKKIKAHVNFTHGEGYGHPLLLASLSGKPILASNWSGHLDFLNPQYTNLLTGEIKQIPPESANEWLIREAGWFNVNYEQAGRKMKGLIDNYEKLLEKAENLRVENMEKFSLLQMDKAFHALLDKYIPEFPTEQKIILPKLKKIVNPQIVLPISSSV
jgi:hypothetical protein